MSQKILVVDDDNDMCMLLNRFLTRKGFEVVGINSGGAALAWMQKQKPDLMLTDFRLDDMTGAQLMSQAKVMHPGVPVIVITGYSDVKDAVEVMKMGAYDYVTKPLVPDEILMTIKKALEEAPEPVAEEAKDNKKAKGDSAKPAGGAKSMQTINAGQYIFGDSPEFAQILAQIDLVAPTNFSVIIYGESGSGKEAIAQQIHHRSNRAKKPFVAIDCGALSKELAASEMFGHIKGSFTGAVTDKVGSFETANEGTIFLDEIANLSYDIQVSLLRVIQERKMRRVGSNKDISLDVRIIVASNEKLWEAARTGKFREDLYHRFNEFSIEVPPLRKRRTDLMTFANHFLQATNAELQKDVQGFSKEVEEIFLNYVWPGNLRELKNVVKRATLLTAGKLVEPVSLPFEINNFQRLQFEEEEPAMTEGPLSKTKSPNLEGQGAGRKKAAAETEDTEYEELLEALKETDGNKTKAAKILGIPTKTLTARMKEYDELKTEKGN